MCSRYIVTLQEYCAVLCPVPAGEGENDYDYDYDDDAIEMQNLTNQTSRTYKHPSLSLTSCSLLLKPS
jgi:hypothetical protein